MNSNPSIGLQFSWALIVADEKYRVKKTPKPASTNARGFSPYKHNTFIFDP
jgi:hypothetical protein